MNDLLNKARRNAGSGQHLQTQVQELVQNRAEVSVLNVVFESAYGLPRKLNQLRLDLLEVACAHEAFTPVTKYSSHNRCYCCTPNELAIGECSMPALDKESMPVKLIEIERFTYQTTDGNLAANARANEERIGKMRERNRALIAELSGLVSELQDLEAVFDGKAQVPTDQTAIPGTPRKASLAELVGPAFLGNGDKTP